MSINDIPLFWSFLTYLPTLSYSITSLFGLSWTPLPTLIWDVINGRFLTWHLTFAAVFKWMLVKVGSFLQELLSFHILDNPNASHTQTARKLATIGGYICEFVYILITLHCTVHLPDTWHLLLSSNECYWKQAVFCRNLHRIGEPSRDIAC